MQLDGGALVDHDVLRRRHELGQDVDDVLGSGAVGRRRLVGRLDVLVLVVGVQVVVVVAVRFPGN